MRELEKLEEIKEFLFNLKSRNFSGATLGTKKEVFQIKGNYNILNLRGAKGHVMIESEFTNFIDASNAKGLLIILKGTFNIVDGSGGKIKIVRDKAYINQLDTSGSEEIQIKDIDIPEKKAEIEDDLW